MEAKQLKQLTGTETVLVLAFVLIPAIALLGVHDWPTITQYSVNSWAFIKHVAITIGQSAQVGIDATYRLFGGL